MRRLRKDDPVVVITGRYKGTHGHIIDFVGEDRVLVEGVNMVSKHIRARQEGEQSRIEREEAPIHISNIAIVNEDTDKRDKVTFKVEDGKKYRVFKSTGERVNI